MNAATIESVSVCDPAARRREAAGGQLRARPSAGCAGPRVVARISEVGSISTSPLRLTRRGRVAVLVLILAGVFGGGLVFGSKASGADSRPASAPGLRTVVVQPGQTLWTIARNADPKGDPRAMIDRIIAINALRGAGIAAGHRLLVP